MTNSMWLRGLSLVVPIYGALNSVRNLLLSLEKTLAANAEAKLDKVILVQDKPDDSEMNSFLAQIASSSHLPFEIITNKTNLGFVASANLGLELTSSNVLLLNSDTVLYEGWLESFYRRTSQFEALNTPWASMTPFSNAATIASLPRMCEEYHEFPGKNSPDKLAKLCQFLFSEAVDALEIPVGVGFCMLLNRTTLDKIGHFSDEFSPGYGEETDWCMRARANGFKHYLIPEVFVYHEGSQSFGSEKSALIERSTKLMLEKYPDYEKLTQSFFDASSNHQYQRQVEPVFRFLSLLEDQGQESALILSQTRTDSGFQMYDLELDGKYFAELSQPAISWLFEQLSELNAIELTVPPETIAFSAGTIYLR